MTSCPSLDTHAHEVPNLQPALAQVWMDTLHFEAAHGKVICQAESEEQEGGLGSQCGGGVEDCCCCCCCVLWVSEYIYMVEFFGLCVRGSEATQEERSKHACWVGLRG